MLTLYQCSIKDISVTCGKKTKISMNACLPLFVRPKENGSPPLHLVFVFTNNHVLIMCVCMYLCIWGFGVAFDMDYADDHDAVFATHTRRQEFCSVSVTNWRQATEFFYQKRTCLESDRHSWDLFWYLLNMLYAC